MRICQRCSQQTSDDRKICRACGGIIEEVPDDALPKETIPSSPSNLIEEEVSDWLKSPEQATGEAPGADEALPVESEARQGEQAEAPDWKCGQCGEMVPGTFDVCWKCMTTSNGEKPDPTELERLEWFKGLSDASDDDQEVAPDPRCAEAPGMEDAENTTTVGDLITLLEQHPRDCVLGLEVVESDGVSSVYHPELEEVAPRCYDPDVCEAAFRLHGGWWPPYVNLVVLSRG